MSDLDLLVAGALVTFLAVAGAYIAIRHRANETPVDSFKPESDALSKPAVIQPQVDAS
ncbi:MAG: hypothetical protein WBM48_11050 [Polyangiales bacterium]|jgi:hypothetical protein